MISTLTFLATDSMAEANPLLGKLANFLGVNCARLEIEDFLAMSPPAEKPVVALDSSALQSLFSHGRANMERRNRLMARISGLIVCAFGNVRENAELLRTLTDGALGPVSLVSTGKREYFFSRALRQHDIPLAGLSWITEESRETFVFTDISGSGSVETLISVNGAPVLAFLRIHDVPVFLLSDAGVVDLDAELKPGGALEDFYSAMLPAVVLLRMTFGRSCWTSPYHEANLIIDDPLIRPRYGFVNYSRLVSEAELNSYAVTIAFIPFNHARSDRRTADFLRAHLDRFSLAVHGCDHTGGEYGTHDGILLMQKSHLAMVRMKNHERSVALPFDSVMVFPQGCYSTQAIETLKDNGYHAAVNTVIHPTDAVAHPLTVHDLMDGAVMAYHDFPLFLRHYPRGVFDFAVDLLLGKPVLLVEHQGYFKHGYAHLAEFTRQLNALVSGLEWKPLGAVVTGHALFRPLGPAHYAVKFFTPVFRLRNPNAISTIFDLKKKERDAHAVEYVLVDDRRVDFAVERGFLNLTVEVPGKGERRIGVIYRSRPVPSYRTSIRYRFRTAARRYLSEFRDNYLARNTHALSIASRVKQFLRPSK